jgi:lipopolysaccharide biosynthesis protein
MLKCVAMNDSTLLKSVGQSQSSIFSADSQLLRLIAFYLPQYHPIPENDEWWGKGFTEWTNVTKATPLFDGHYQPHLPTDFGFYDLRVRETRHDQIRTAKEYAIDGFCYHYYWFSGTRILRHPLDDMLSDPQSDMPFCLCWANENWTRRWDAAENEILLEQHYLPNDDLDFIKSLIPFFTDSRYIKIDGAPFFIVYRPQNLPHPRKTSRIWRDYCKSIGIDKIHICAALTHGNEDYTQFDFDSGVEFPPHNLKVDSISSQIAFYNAFRGNVMKYRDVARSYLYRSHKSRNVFRSVFPSWDNTARTNDRALIILNSTPNNYEYWLCEAIRKTREDFPDQERFVFINAWNEWAEGCHLEPDRKYQRQYLDATLHAKTGMSKCQEFDNDVLQSLPVEHRRTFVGDLYTIIDYHIALGLGRIRFWIRSHPRIRGLARKVRRFWR